MELLPDEQPDSPPETPQPEPDLGDLMDYERHAYD